MTTGHPRFLEAIPGVQVQIDQLDWLAVEFSDTLKQYQVPNLKEDGSVEYLTTGQNTVIRDRTDNDHLPLYGFVHGLMPLVGDLWTDLAQRKSQPRSYIGGVNYTSGTFVLDTGTPA